MKECLREALKVRAETETVEVVCFEMKLALAMAEWGRDSTLKMRLRDELRLVLGNT